MTEYSTNLVSLLNDYFFLFRRLAARLFSSAWRRARLVRVSTCRRCPRSTFPPSRSSRRRATFSASASRGALKRQRRSSRGLFYKSHHGLHIFYAANASISAESSSIPAPALELTSKGHSRSTTTSPNGLDRISPCTSAATLASTRGWTRSHFVKTSETGTYDYNHFNNSITLVKYSVIFWNEKYNQAHLRDA